MSTIQCLPCREYIQDRPRDSPQERFPYLFHYPKHQRQTPEQPGPAAVWVLPTEGWFQRITAQSMLADTYTQACAHTHLHTYSDIYTYIHMHAHRDTEIQTHMHLLA